MRAPRASKAPAMQRRAFRMSLSDFAILDQFSRMAGTSDAAYLRWLLQREAGRSPVLPVPPKRKPALVSLMHVAADPILLLQIARLGNLLNQIARAANECRLNGSTLDLIQLLALLLIIQNQSELLASPAVPISPSEIRL